MLTSSKPYKVFILRHIPDHYSPKTHSYPDFTPIQGAHILAASPEGALEKAKLAFPNFAPQLAVEPVK